MNDEQAQVASPDTSNAQNDSNKPVVPQSNNNFRQPGYIIPKYEDLKKYNFRNGQQTVSQEQPNQELQSGQSAGNEIPQKPPIEIREIPSHSSSEPEQQYTQVPEESNSPEQNENNPHPENQGI